MGQYWFVALERDIGVNCDIDPTGFLSSLGNRIMYDLAVQQNLKPLQSFNSCSLEDQEKFARHFEYISEETPEKWFEASEGLLCIRDFLSYLRDDPSIPGVPDPPMLPSLDEFVQWMIRDLEATESVLVEAEKQNVRFHFAAVAP